MAVKVRPVLESDDLNDADEAILDGLHEGRGTPKHLAGLLNTDRSYVSQRLKRLVEHGHVDRVASGLYEIVDDPREDVESKPDVNVLRECIDETQSELEKIEAAFEHGDQEQARNALERAQEILSGSHLEE